MTRRTRYAIPLYFSAVAVLAGVGHAQTSSLPANVGEALARYVVVQEALAADDEGRAREALAALVEVSDGERLTLAQAVLDAPTGIDPVRMAFRDLSDYYANLNLPDGFAGAYCPMYAGGSRWVQRDGPIRNPYHGKSMLTCGVLDAAPGAHMDHTPRHGGIVFMAPDSFHHLEGTYPAPGVFRLYVTDNYREPVDTDGWTGRAVLGEEYDAASDTFREVSAGTLAPAPGGEYLEARVGDLPMPAEVTAKVTMQADFPEERFDFIFADVSAPVESVPTFTPTVTETVPLAERIMPNIPDASSGIVSEIAVRDGQIQALIERGAFAELFVPALQAKELALALSARAEADETVSGADREALGIAVRGIVRSAWLLDWYGDLGNRQQVDEAYEIFARSVSDVGRVFGEGQ